MNWVPDRYPITACNHWSKSGSIRKERSMKWLTVSEVSERYRRTDRQIRAAIHRGVLPANRPPGAKDYRIAENDAERTFGIAATQPSGRPPEAA